MNFGDLQDEVKDLLNFASGQVHQDFTEDQIKKSINRAYDREVRKARQEGITSYFIDDVTITWTSGATTYALTDPEDKAQLIQIWDVTNGQPGSPLEFNEDFRWKDRNTLEWLPSGPSEDRSLRFTFYELPKPMVANTEEPTLVRREFREILTYSAAIELRLRADEEAPASWERHLSESRMDWYKDLSKGRPMRNYPQFFNPEVQVDDQFGF